MPAGVVLLVLVAMALGLIGTVVPVLPGLPLIWGAALAGFLTAGWDRTGTITMTVLTLLLVSGVAAKYVLPARRAGQTASGRSLLWAAAGAVVGFFVIPVVGFAVGGVAGLYLAEHRRTGDPEAARANTVMAIRRFGIGVLLEVAAGISMILVWLMAVTLG